MEGQTVQTEVMEQVENVSETSQDATETQEEVKKGKTTPRNRNAEMKALQEELDTFRTENGQLKTQLEEYQSKLKELESKVAEYESKSAEYLSTIKQKDVSLKLAEKGLSEFQEFFSNVNDEQLDQQIDKFTQLLKEKEIDNSFKPTSHKQDDSYSVAKNNGDLKSMFSSILFKK